MLDSSCIFCKIIRGEIPSTKIYENEFVVAFLDINPVNHGHTVIIPKNHVDQLQDVDPVTYVQIMNVAHNVSKKIKDVLNPPRVGLMVWGFEVSHAHVHVVPLQQPSDFTMRHNVKPSFEEFAEISSKLNMN
jgi:histidine triad (HIT) family protein